MQFLAGQRVALNRVTEQIEALGHPAVIVEIGGGTGAFRQCCPRSAYICLDSDPAKLRGYRTKFPDGLCILGDGAQVPVADKSLDLVMCIAVLHHIPSEFLPSLMREVDRVLKPDGRLLVLDPVWKPTRLPGRLLWRYDRGSFPRTATALETMVAESMQVERADRFRFLHEYLLCVARKREPAKVQP